MRTNFEIEQNIFVEYKSNYIDLHNNFDFKGMVEDSNKNEIILEFTRSKAEWAHKEKYELVSFKFKNVSYKYFENGNKNDFIEDSKCLGEISFFPSNMREINDCFTGARQCTENDDLLFVFENGKVIRIKSEEVEFMVKNAKCY